MGNVRYDIEYRGEEVGNVKVPWEHGDHVSVEDYEDLTEQLAALSEAVRALPVEDLVQTGPDGGPELVGYGMMAQGEWDRVKAALPPQEPTT